MVYLEEDRPVRFLATVQTAGFATASNTARARGFAELHEAISWIKAIIYEVGGSDVYEEKRYITKEENVPLDKAVWTETYVVIAMDTPVWGCVVAVSLGDKQ